MNVQSLGAKVNSYFDTVRAGMKLDPAVKRTVLRELRSHFEDRYEELRRQGLSEDAARERAMKSLGSPKLVAQQLVDLYSQGTWKQAIFAAVPHLIVAWLLWIRAWQGSPLVSIALLGLTLAFVVAVVVYGWWQGKPTWLFPWLGYYLLPVIAAGALVISLPAGWNWLVGVVYIPLGCAALFYIVRQTLKEDWLLASLMLLPMPIVIFWIAAIGFDADPEWMNWRLFNAAPGIALSFLALAVTSATFVRVKQRRVKVAALITPEVGLLVLLGVTTPTSMGFLGWAVLTVGSLALLLSPAWLEARFRQR